MLSVQAAQLDALTTMLEGLEYKASLWDPVAGQQPIERGQIRARIVEHHQMMHGPANGVPSIFLGLRSGPSFRWYALDERRAMAIQQSLASEIPKMQGGPASH
jgi:hypothetical protein